MEIDGALVVLDSMEFNYPRRSIEKISGKPVRPPTMNMMKVGIDIPKIVVPGMS